MALDAFERPIMAAVRTQVLTAQAAARHMIRQGAGGHLATIGLTHMCPRWDAHIVGGRHPIACARWTWSGLEGDRAPQRGQGRAGATSTTTAKTARYEKFA